VDWCRGNFEKMKEIIPAILPENYKDLLGHVEALEGSVSLVQIDICDGVFVPSKCWPYKNDSVELGKILEQEEGLPEWMTMDYEIDLMVQNPKEDAEKWIQAGAKRLIFHIESDGILETIEMLKADHKYTKEDDLLEVGIAINIDTPISVLENVIDDISCVQCMGIARIGFQNEKFDERVLNKIKEIREKYPDILISIDGGVDFENLQSLIDAGVDRFVAGHSIFQGELEPKDSVAKFRNLI
jgi:ribulose-phosphate 3-epimerase